MVGVDEIAIPHIRFLNLLVYVIVTQVCRCAGQRSSDMVQVCMNNRGGVGGDSGGMSFGNTLFLLMAVAGVMTAAGFAHYKRTQAHMRDQVHALLVRASA